MSDADIFTRCAIIIETPWARLPSTYATETAKAILDARLVAVDSVDCDALTLAVALMQATREGITPTAENEEWLARVVAAEAVMKRIIIDSMMRSEIAKAYLAQSPQVQP